MIDDDELPRAMVSSRPETAPPHIAPTPPPRHDWKRPELYVTLGMMALGGAVERGWLGNKTPLEDIAGMLLIVLAGMGYTFTRIPRS